MRNYFYFSAYPPLSIITDRLYICNEIVKKKKLIYNQHNKRNVKFCHFIFFEWYLRKSCFNY